MELTFKSRNGKITDRQRQHIQDKLGKLERYLDTVNSATVEVSTEQRRGVGEVQRVQVTLVGNHGVILRAEEHAPDLYGAVDAVQGSLQRQAVRYKDRHWKRGKPRRQDERLVEGEVPATTATLTEDEEAERVPQLVRTKTFLLKPMFSEEAVEQMELLDHSFFIFRDADSMKVSVVYRRADGNYGLIVPEEA